MTIIKNIKTAARAYFSRRKEKRDNAVRSRRIRVAERDIQVREYKSELWLACKEVPLVPVQTIGAGDALYSALSLARLNYIELCLKEIIK